MANVYLSIVVDTDKYPGIVATSVETYLRSLDYNIVKVMATDGPEPAPKAAYEHAARVQRATALYGLLTSRGVDTARVSRLSTSEWRSLGEQLKFKRPPSADTCKMVIDMYRSRDSDPVPA